MTREEMMNKIIQDRGFEDIYTVWFCSIAENKKLNLASVQLAFAVAMTMPYETEGDD